MDTCSAQRVGGEVAHLCGDEVGGGAVVFGAADVAHAAAVLHRA
jgi:hypothetical protein